VAALKAATGIALKQTTVTDEDFSFYKGSLIMPKDSPATKKILFS
jgi:hypothetical protein